MEREEGNWRKASYSNGQGDCVEVADAARVVLVRDTKDRDGGTLAFTPDAWRGFLAEQRLGVGTTQHLPGHPSLGGVPVASMASSDGRALMPPAVMGIGLETCPKRRGERF